ncbi:hypothetical protein GCM10007989_19940 [Devosia pacifica]|uniref:Uncharacterized protein n=2 Tax=Devosia pacifica TaxID=1335967 RepID=A0A918VUJ4_9HYPH|nr:hypothetical protein GCM10007989_19940 [Devosia pacifica]
MRTAFFALLAGTASVLYIDYRELMATTPPEALPEAQPILPPASQDGGNTGPRPEITTAPELLEEPLSITLGGQGELRLTGTMDQGSAARFAEEIAARGEYVETVVLDSPGGSVSDALEMGTLIHEKGYATRVPAGALCASACPIVFASGAERIASPQSAIGVHQVYAAAITGNPQAMLEAAGIAMSEAQRTTARITRHLTMTGVDPEMWLLALETPPDRLHYFTEKEMTGFNLVTSLEEESNSSR